MENTNLNNIEFIRSIEEEYSIENMKFSELNLFIVNKIEIYTWFQRRDAFFV